MATINGTAASDLLIGTANPDTIFGFGGDDSIWAGGGNDQVYGGAGNDAIFAGAGADKVYGGAGQDYLNGGAGADFLDGGENQDILIAGEGLDTLIGGRASDVYNVSDTLDLRDDIILAKSDYPGTEGALSADKITGFETKGLGADEDIIHFAGFSASDQLSFHEGDAGSAFFDYFTWDHDGGSTVMATVAHEDGTPLNLQTGVLEFSAAEGWIFH